MTAIDAPTPAARLAHLACQIRIAFRLLYGAERREHLLLAAMTAAATAAAWPLAGVVHALVAIPAVLLLAALIRHHEDGLTERRNALASAGADLSDTVVITAVGPIAAAAAGSVVGTLATLVSGHPHALLSHALLPLLAAVVATLVLRPAWIGAPALAAGTVAASVAALAIVVSDAATRSTALVAATSGGTVPASAASTASHAAAWGHASLPAVAAALVVAAAQVAGRKRKPRSRG